MKVLIVGGGVSGLALGAFLRKRNIAFDIVECASADGPRGHLIGLWSNSRQIFKQLDLDTQFDQLGNPLETYVLEDKNSVLLRKYSFLNFKAQYGCALTIFEREVVHRSLEEKIGTKNVQFEKTFESLEQNEFSVTVTFEDGERREYDTVIGADGSHSRVRKVVFGDRGFYTTPWYSRWMWIENTIIDPSVFIEHVEDNFVAVMASSKDKSAINYFYTDFTKDNVHKRLSAVLKCHNIVCDTSVIPEHSVNLVDVSLPQWCKGRVALMGDAAHCMGPYAGLGASMALEDAYVLSNQLALVTDTVSLSGALERYEQLRAQRLSTMEKATSLMKHVTFVQSKYLRRCVDTVIPFLPESLFTYNFKRLFDESFPPQN